MKRLYPVTRLACSLFILVVLSGCLGPLASPGITPSPTAAPTSTTPPAQTPPAAATRAASELMLPTPTFTPSQLPPASTPTALPSATPTAAPSPTPAPAPTATPSVTSGQRALQHVRQLSEVIGSRPAGSQQERAGADYIAGQLRGFGYAVERQSFAFPYFVDRGSRLELPAQPRGLHALTMGLSAAGELEAPLSNAGLGRPTDLPREGLAGRIALVQRGEITFDDKVRNAARAGAAGVIIYNNTQGNFRGRLSDLATIPVLTIPQDEGEFLLQSLSRGPLVARISVDATSETRQGQNIIATRPGARPDMVIFGAHYDSVEAGPGANDNASGTAAMLELARLAQPGPLTLRFIAFAAEELGLHGSRHYVSTVGDDQRRLIRAMFSLDMVGVGNRIRFGGSPDLVSLGMAVAAERRLDARPLEGGAASASDHGSFMAAGMPGVLIEYTIGNDLDPRYHSAEDKAQFVDPASIENVIRVSQALVDRLAGGQ